MTSDEKIDGLDAIIEDLIEWELSSMNMDALESFYLHTKKEQYKNNPEDLEEIGRAPWPNKVLKQDLRYHIESDKEMIVMNTKIAYQEELVDVCQEMIKNINNRGFVIKNSIDFMRFTMGA